MKLLFVIKELGRQGGGAEKVFICVVNALISRGHDVEVVTLDGHGQQVFYDMSSKVTHHTIGDFIPRGAKSIRKLPIFAAKVRLIVKQGQPDVVIAFMHSSYVPVTIGVAGLGVPVIISEHTAAAHFKTRPVQKLLSQLAQRLAYAKTVVSPVIYEEHSVRWKYNLHILPNPVDIAEMIDANEPTVGNKILLCIGGLRLEKDQRTLIEAFDRVAADFPEWRLRLVGEGDMRPAIEQRIADSPYADRIELPGIIRDVGAEYRKASIVAMPSLYEAMPMVAIEAMASGRPVIGFADCAGAVALVRHELNGLLVEPGKDRPGRFAEGIRKLMKDEVLRTRLGAMAPETVQSFSLDKVIEKWERLIRAAAASDSCKPH